MEKKLFNDLRKAANATCGNAYLMDDGRIVTAREYKMMAFIDRLRTVMFYRYADRKIVRI